MLKVKTRRGKAFVARIDVAGTFEFGSVPIPRRDSPTRFFQVLSFFSFVSFLVNDDNRSLFLTLPFRREDSIVYHHGLAVA